MATIKTSFAVIEYQDDDAVKQAIFDRVMAYYKKHDAYCGETIHQTDDTIIDAPSVMSDIADDILRFKVEWDE